MEVEKNILIIIAKDGFNDTEFFTTFNFLKEKGFNISIASIESGPCKSKDGEVVLADLSFNDASVDSFCAFVLIGGLGILDFENNFSLQNLLKEANKVGKIIGSICISPRILISAGILNGKRFTMWNEDNSQNLYIEKSGGIYTGNDVEVDEKIVTANGPHASQKFVETIFNQIISIYGSNRSFF